MYGVEVVWGISSRRGRGLWRRRQRLGICRCGLYVVVAGCFGGGGWRVVSIELWLRDATTIVDTSGQERLTLDRWRRLGLDWLCWQDGLVMVAHGDEAMTIRGGDVDAGTVWYGAVRYGTVQ
jgi:hypothetical protein